MEIWVWSLIILNIVTITLLFMQVRERQGLERDLDDLERAHYELRKETGRPSPAEMIRESTQRLGEVFVKGLGTHGDYWSGGDSRG